MKVGIIGIGYVGTSKSLSILHAGIAHEVLFYDIDVARAEALGINSLALAFKSAHKFSSFTNGDLSALLGLTFLAVILEEFGDATTSRRATYQPR